MLLLLHPTPLEPTDKTTLTNRSKDGVLQDSLKGVAASRKMGDRDTRLVVFALLGSLLALLCTEAARTLAIGPSMFVGRSGLFIRGRRGRGRAMVVVALVGSVVGAVSCGFAREGGLGHDGTIDIRGTVG